MHREKVPTLEKQHTLKRLSGMRCIQFKAQLQNWSIGCLFFSVVIIVIGVLPSEALNGIVYAYLRQMMLCCFEQTGLTRKIEQKRHNQYKKRQHSNTQQQKCMFWCTWSNLIGTPLISAHSTRTCTVAMVSHHQRGKAEFFLRFIFCISSVASGCLLDPFFLLQIRLVVL